MAELSLKLCKNLFIYLFPRPVLTKLQFSTYAIIFFKFNTDLGIAHLESPSDGSII